MKRLIDQYKKELSANTFSLKLIKVIYSIFNFLQMFLTITGHMRIYLLWKQENFKADKYEKERIFRGYVTGFALAWFFILLFGFILLNQYKALSFLSIYILWDIFIINFWMFIFRQKSVSISHKKGRKEDDIRLFLLLIFKFITTILCFAIMYSYLYSINPHSFSSNSGFGAIYKFDFVYYSIVVITTLGFGDIFPTHFCSRAITSAEVLFGFFFILLFFNLVLGQIKFSWQKK